MTASHIRVLVWVQATLLPIWLPANLSGRSEEGGLITCIPTACAGELDESLDPGFSFAWSWLLQFLFQQMENLSLLSLSSCTSAFQINKYFLKRKNHDSVFVRLISIDSFYHCLTYPTLKINASVWSWAKNEYYNCTTLPRTVKLFDEGMEWKVKWDCDLTKGRELIFISCSFSASNAVALK